MPESFITLLKKYPTINSQFRRGERKVLCEETEGTSSIAQRLMSIMSPMFHSAQQSHKGSCQGYGTASFARRTKKCLRTLRMLPQTHEGVKTRVFHVGLRRKRAKLYLGFSNAQIAAPKPLPNPFLPATTTLEGETWEHQCREHRRLSLVTA